jgi:hypothetical protein
LKVHIEREHSKDQDYQILKDRLDLFDMGFMGDLSKVGWSSKLA